MRTRPLGGHFALRWGGGARPDGREPQACKSASLAMALSKILGSGMSCTWSLLLNFGLSLGIYAQPSSVPDLTVMVVADGRATIVGISTLVAVPVLSDPNNRWRI